MRSSDAGHAPVAIVVVSWNCAGYLEECLGSLRELRRYSAVSVARVAEVAWPAQSAWRAYSGQGPSCVARAVRRVHMSSVVIRLLASSLPGTPGFPEPSQSRPGASQSFLRASQSSLLEGRVLVKQVMLHLLLLCAR